MSMISAQVDQLRKAAEEEWDMGDGSMFVLLRDAADTIRELRDTAQQAQAENAKLRELVRTLYMCSNAQCDRCEFLCGNCCEFNTEEEMRGLGVEVEQ